MPQADLNPLVEAAPVIAAGSHLGHFRNRPVASPEYMARRGEVG